MNESEKRGRLVIRGANVLEAPLFSTTKAKVVEFYDTQDELVALLIKGVLGPEMWVFANKLDDDWEQVLVRFGYRHVPRTEFEQLVQSDSLKKE